MSEGGDSGFRVLLVEDEPHLALGLVENLEAEGYQVLHCADGTTGLAELISGRFDLAILDVMLPGMDGFSLCEAARRDGVATPVLFLTAKGGVDDRIRGLRAGGDDYLPKPFHLDELLLRVAAVLRRGRGDESELLSISFGGNVVDLQAYRATSWNGEMHQMTHKEAMILKTLASRAGEVVSRDEILDRVWGRDVYPSSRTIDNFILKLRRRFEREPDLPLHFHSVRGVGYRFTLEPE